MAAFDTMFCGHPEEWDIYEADLEELRRKRNSVGHALFSLHAFITHNVGKKWNDKEMGNAFRKKYPNTRLPKNKQFFLDMVSYYKNA